MNPETKTILESVSSYVIQQAAL